MTAKQDQEAYLYMLESEIVESECRRRKHLQLSESSESSEKRRTQNEK